MAPILIVVIGLVCLVPVVALFVIGAFWVVPVGGARTISLATQSQNNLRQIGLALHGYHDVNSSFPPAYLEDENGRVIASWRVLVLPYLDHRPVFADYDFSASWDAPVNAQMRMAPVTIYQSPIAPFVDGAPQTHYFCITGEGTVFEGSKPCPIAEITDGLSNTAVVIEVHGLNVEWSEPRDVDVSDLASLMAEGGFNATQGKIRVLMADGSVRTLEAADVSQLVSMALKADGQ